MERVKFPTNLLGKGVARNKYLGGLVCNRDILNIILKSIGYKIINLHISLYTWTCWEFNRNSKPVRNKKIRENKTPKEKQLHVQNNIYVVRQFAYVHRVAGISLLSKKITMCGYNVFLSQKQQQDKTLITKKMAFISCT